MSLAKALTNARISSERAVDMCRKAVAAPASGANLIVGGMPMAHGGTGRAANQLAHFRGHQFTAVSAIAKRIAGQPFHVYSRRGGGGLVTKAAEAKELTSHPLIDILNDPNPILCQWQMMFSTVACLNLTGKAYWWFTNDGDLWPVPPHWIEPADALRTAWKIRPFNSAEALTVDGQYVAYFCLPDPSDPFGAMSPTQAQAAAIDTDEQLQAAQAHSFRNIMKPGLILKAGKLPGPPEMGGGQLPVLTEAQRLQLITSIRNYYQGVHRNGEPMILDGMVEDVHELQTKSEMDWLQSGDQTRGRIFHAFGVNPLIVGEIQGANRAQATVAEESFCSNVCNPLITLLNQVLNGWVAPLFAAEGEELTIEIEPCRARDPEQTLKEWSVAATRGWVTGNEWRANILGLQPLDGLDEAGSSQPQLPPPALDLAKRINPYSLKQIDG
jgi:HK97 family phage portal protein